MKTIEVWYNSYDESIYITVRKNGKTDYVYFVFPPAWEESGWMWETVRNIHRGEIDIDILESVVESFPERDEDYEGWTVEDYYDTNILGELVMTYDGIHFELKSISENEVLTRYEVPGKIVVEYMKHPILEAFGVNRWSELEICLKKGETL